MSKKLIITVLTLIGLALLCVGYGYFIEPGRLVVRHSEIRIMDWDPAFDGYRIVMISDVHGGSNGASAEQLRRVVESANAVEPDVIVLLGDYVSQVRENKPIDQRSLRMSTTEIADNLAGLRAKDGVFAVLGNHDWWYGEEKVAAELRRVGFRVLADELATVERGEKQLAFLGLRDHINISSWAQFTANARHLAMPASGDVVVLGHSPDIVPFISGEHSISPKTRLLLTAHTHGGQVWLPILGPPIVPSTYGQKYAYGHIVDSGLDIWVTSGIGTSVLPFRFMVPPEIVVLTVRSA